MSLRDEIAKIIEEENAYGYYAPDRAEELADQILALLEGELEKARKWDILLKRCNDIIKEG